MPLYSRFIATAFEEQFRYDVTWKGTRLLSHDSFLASTSFGVEYSDAKLCIAKRQLCESTNRTAFLQSLPSSELEAAMGKVFFFFRTLNIPSVRR